MARNTERIGVNGGNMNSAGPGDRVSLVYQTIF